MKKILLRVDHLRMQSEKSKFQTITRNGDISILMK